jgi:hypothetical protein
LKVIEAAVKRPSVMLADVGFADRVAVDGGMATGTWAQLALDANWRGGDDGLAVLADLPELTYIDMRQTKLTDKALAHLAKLPKLKQLNLHQAGFSRDALLKFHRQHPAVVVYSRGDAMMGINGDLNSSPLVLTTIQDGSGAAQAGLQVGDVVHRIDGVQIRDFSDLTICVTARKPGTDRSRVRARKKRTVEVTLTQRTVDATCAFIATAISALEQADHINNRIPPSTGNIAPVMNAAAVEHRKIAAPATSSGTQRPSVRS